MLFLLGTYINKKPLKLITVKKLLLPLLALLFFISCEKESYSDLQMEQQLYDNSPMTLRSPTPKIDVCHYDAENNSWHVINISGNAWPDHQGHGDVRLDDRDGDGYVPNNACDYGQQGDCDDNDAAVNPGAEEVCDNSIDDDCDGDVDEADSDCSTSCVEGEVKIDYNGPLFVAPSDEVFVYTWQLAKDACAAKSEIDGCEWYLPSKDELNALYLARNVIGGFDQSGNYPGSYYWSSTESSFNNAWAQIFGNGLQGDANKQSAGSCRCVRR